MAFPSSYRKSRRFYVYYTRGDGNNVVAEFKRSRWRRTRAVTSSRRRVLVIPHPEDTSNHNGGQLQFGPDGFLYIATGDGGRRRAPQQTSKCRRASRCESTPAGGTVAATGPRGTPRRASGRNEIFSHGLRNPWRFSFDSANGRLSIGDVGANSARRWTTSRGPGPGEATSAGRDGKVTSTSRQSPGHWPAHRPDLRLSPLHGLRETSPAARPGSLHCHRYVIGSDCQKEKLCGNSR